MHMFLQDKMCIYFAGTCYQECNVQLLQTPTPAFMPYLCAGSVRKLEEVSVNCKGAHQHPPSHLPWWQSGL